MSEVDKYRDLLNHETDKTEDEFAEFLKKSADAKLPKGRGKEAIWSAIEDEISGKETEEKPAVNLWAYSGIAAAVTILIAFTIVFWDSGSPINHSTSIAQSQEITLPDGSVATLNANSQLSYSEDWNREVELTGEAFFEVEKGGRFLVKTPIGNVQVLGTSFNVFDREGEFEVACKTGKVNISIPSKAYNQDITPGQIVLLESDTVKQYERLPDLMGKWKTGEFYYSEQPISDVLDELKRQFDVQIDFQQSEDILFSGYFTNKNVETALDMVFLPLGYEYEMVGEKRFVIKESE
ncbi:MAG: FecR domain-containing protein [Cyclobacteriaceae bacterium]